MEENSDNKKQINENKENIQNPEKCKKSKKKKIWLIIILAVFLLIILAVLALLLPLYKAYNDSYTHIDIITRDGEYSRPDLPTDIIIESDGFDGEDYPPDTDPSDTADVPGTDTCPADTDNSVTEPSDTGDKPVTSEPDEEEPPEDHVVIENGIYYVKQKDPNIENVLIIGTDSKKFYGRSDSMIVASLNKKTGSIKLVSLLRDIYVPIEGHKWNRLNTAFAFGGISLCINTINSLFDLDIQKFVVINFNGTKDVVDLCGGIDMQLSEKEANHLINYCKKDITKNEDGTYHLDGDAALAYMRIRKLDSDFKRTERQRKAMLALYTQAVESNGLDDIYNLIKEGFKLIKTNIKLNDLLDKAKYVISNLGSNPDVVSEHIPYGENGGAWHYARTHSGKAVITIDFDKNTAYLHKILYD